MKTLGSALCYGIAVLAVAVVFLLILCIVTATPLTTTMVGCCIVASIGVVLGVILGRTFK